MALGRWRGHRILRPTLSAPGLASLLVADTRSRLAPCANLVGKAYRMIAFVCLSRQICR
jgi:hypothetical protein